MNEINIELFVLKLHGFGSNFASCSAGYQLPMEMEDEKFIAFMNFHVIHVAVFRLSDTFDTEKRWTTPPASCTGWRLACPSMRWHFQDKKERRRNVAVVKLIEVHVKWVIQRVSKKPSLTLSESEITIEGAPFRAQFQGRFYWSVPTMTRASKVQTFPASHTSRQRYKNTDTWMTGLWSTVEAKGLSVT